MIKRIVKLTLREEAVPEFLMIFEQTRDLIRAFDGCHHLELLQDIQEPGRVFTLSTWESQEALDRYRDSDLFGKTWKKTKALFAGKPEAWSVTDTPVSPAP